MNIHSLHRGRLAATLALSIGLLAGCARPGDPGPAGLMGPSGPQGSPGQDLVGASVVAQQYFDTAAPGSLPASLSSTFSGNSSAQVSGGVYLSPSQSLKVAAKSAYWGSVVWDLSAAHMGDSSFSFALGRGSSPSIPSTALSAIVVLSGHKVGEILVQPQSGAVDRFLWRYNGGEAYQDLEAVPWHRVCIVFDSVQGMSSLSVDSVLLGTRLPFSAYSPVGRPTSYVEWAFSPQTDQDWYLEDLVLKQR